MPKKEWGWLVNHTLDNKTYALNDIGAVASATIKNDGVNRLHIYSFGIQFQWQRSEGFWWAEKCDIFLDSDEETDLPAVAFRIPLDIEPRDYKYTIGVSSESCSPESLTSRAKWEDHGIVEGDKDHTVKITKHADRGYQVFISHSNHHEDRPLMKVLSTLLKNNGIGYFIAEETPKYGEILWKKIRKGIFAADRVIILWTQYGAKSLDVREELGITIGARKKFVPVIEKKMKPKGSLVGTEYCTLDRNNAKGVLIEVIRDLIKSSEEKAKRTKKVKPEEGFPF